LHSQQKNQICPYTAIFQCFKGFSNWLSGVASVAKKIVKNYFYKILHIESATPPKLSAAKSPHDRHFLVFQAIFKRASCIEKTSKIYLCRGWCGSLIKHSQKFGFAQSSIFAF